MLGVRTDVDRSRGSSHCRVRGRSMIIFSTSNITVMQEGFIVDTSITNQSTYVLSDGSDHPLKLFVQYNTEIFAACNSFLKLGL